MDRARKRPGPAAGAARWKVGAAALLACLALAACATPGAAPRPSGAAPPGDASPELLFLLGRDHELSGEFEPALALYGRALAADPESVYLLRKVAELSARQNELEAAVGHAERALALEPEDTGTRLFLGTLYRFRRDAAGAERVLRDPEGEPISADAALLLYGLHAEAQRYIEAESAARWLVEHEPEGLRGWFALADLRERQDDTAGAETALRRGLAHHPGDLSLYGALARARRDRGDRVGEIEIYRELLREHPDHHTTLLALSDALLDLERVDEAVETLERVEAQHPEDLRSILRLGFLEFERRNYGASAARFERALQVNPDQHEVAYFLGVVRRRQREPEAAREAFLRIPDSHERYAEARAQLAALYEATGDYEVAIEEVQRARSAQPSRALDLYLASLRAKTGDAEGALSFLQSLLAAAPGDAELLYNIGVIHGESSQPDRALDYMERVLAADPDHAGALNYVGYTWAERGHNLEQAEAYVTRALELRPDDGYIADSLGWIYYMRARPLIESGRRAEGLGMLDRAVRELERANELTGGDPVIAEHLGDAYLLQGDSRRALEFYREAVELGPREEEQPALTEKLQRLEGELGQR